MGSQIVWAEVGKMIGNLCLAGVAIVLAAAAVRGLGAMPCARDSAPLRRSGKGEATMKTFANSNGLYTHL